MIVDLPHALVTDETNPYVSHSEVVRSGCEELLIKLLLSFLLLPAADCLTRRNAPRIQVETSTNGKTKSSTQKKQQPKDPKKGGKFPRPPSTRRDTASLTVIPLVLCDSSYDPAKEGCPRPEGNCSPSQYPFRRPCRFSPVFIRGFVVCPGTGN